AFLRFWNVIYTNEKKIDNHRAFLYQIAKNLITDFYRQKEKSSNIVLASNHPTILNIASEKNLMEEINIESDFEQIKHFIKKIQPEQQEVILLKYVDELETKEIAAIMNKPEGTIRVLLHRGLIALKKHYSNV
ncbi:MAG: RNA polymerase sigma factor, partial [Syntrophales bacterium]